MAPPANMRPPGLEQVGITQKLDTQLPLDLTFRDETGKSVQLKRLFRQEAGDFEFCLLLLPDVVRGSFDRADHLDEGPEV